MDFHRDPNNGAIHITQVDHIQEIIEAARLTEANPKPTPMARFGNFPTAKLDDYLPNVTKYKSLLGKLQFLASHA